MSPVTVCWHVSVYISVSKRVRVGGSDRGRESGVTLAAVPVVSRAVDQVAQEAQSEARLANGLRVS